MSLKELSGSYEVLGAVIMPLKRRMIQMAKNRQRRFFRGAENTAETTWEQALSGGEAEVLGAFLPGLMKVVKKIGKFTSPITTKIAKTFLPASIVNAAAHLDPTKKGNITPAAIAAVKELVQSKAAEAPAVPTATQIQTQALTKTLTSPLVLGIAGAGILVLILMRKRGRK